MSVWDAIVGQRQVVEQLKAVAAGDPASIAQSWLNLRTSRIRTLQRGARVRRRIGKPRPRAR